MAPKPKQSLSDAKICAQLFEDSDEEDNDDLSDISIDEEDDDTPDEVQEIEEVFVAVSDELPVRLSWFRFLLLKEKTEIAFVCFWILLVVVATTKLNNYQYHNVLDS